MTVRNTTRLIYTLFFCLAWGTSFGQTLNSPDGQLELKFWLEAGGAPKYQLEYKDKQVIQPSGLGLELKDQPSLMKGFEIAALEESAKDTPYASLLLKERSGSGSDFSMTGLDSGTNFRNRKT